MKKEYKVFLTDYSRLTGILSVGAKKFLWFLAKDAFLFVLVLILITIVIGEFLFYNYILLIDIKVLETNSQIVSFQEETYNSVVQELKKREDTFNNLPKTDYKSPFY